MKQIEVIVTGMVTVGSDTTTNLTEAMQLIAESRSNRDKVLEGARTFERVLEDIILHYFMGNTHPKRDLFKSLILDSDWCSFAAKRKLVTHIINTLDLLTGSDKPHFDKLMRDVMSFRNAFAHGKFLCRERRVYLSYFEGKPQEKELTDDYLTEVETCLRTAHDKAAALREKLSG